ncbi:hypothetical protein JCM5350_005103 [Sporobolomyces pararoseus]
MSAPRTRPSYGGFDPAKNLDWTVRSKVVAVRELVENRNELFSKHRKIADLTLEAQCLSKESELIARDSSAASTFDRYRDWCDAVNIPHFPLSVSSITLFLVCKTAHKDGWYRTAKMQLCRLRDATVVLWKNVAGNKGLEDNVKAAVAFEAFNNEKRKAFEGKDSRRKKKHSRFDETEESSPNSDDDSSSGSASTSASDSDSDSDSDSKVSTSIKARTKSVKSRRRPSEAQSVSSSNGQVRQLDVPNLPRDGDRFSSANDLLVASYRALLPIYGNGVSLVELQDDTVEIKCGRSNGAYAKSEVGRCRWKLGASFDSNTGEIVVRQAASHLYHNHGQSERFAAHPNWRPTIINPVVREAFGLEKLTTRMGKQHRRFSGPQDELSAKKRRVSDSTDSATQASYSSESTSASYTPSTSSSYSHRPSQASHLYNYDSTSSSSPALVNSPFRSQLESFLKGLHPSLSSLTSPLLSAGIASIDTLTLLCLLDSSTIAKFVNSIQEKAQHSNQPISVVQIKLFEKSIRDAQKSGLRA